MTEKSGKGSTKRPTKISLNQKPYDVCCDCCDCQCTKTAQSSILVIIIGKLPEKKASKTCSHSRESVSNSVYTFLTLVITLTRPGNIYFVCNSHKLSAISWDVHKHIQCILACIAHCKYHVSRVQII